MVIGGVYAFYETVGLPLEMIFAFLWEKKNALPDWLDLVEEMTKAGRPLPATIEAIVMAVHDACCYPVEFEQAITTRIKNLQKD